MILLKNINVLLVSLLLVCISCSDDSDSNSSNNTQQTLNQIKNTAVNGVWEITYFYDTDHEETNNFIGYKFSFNTDGSLNATKDNTTITGSWSITDSNSSSSSSDDLHFNILFFSPPDFEDLSDDWEIISTSDTKIELIDISGGNGGTDYLTFQKL
jgi:hypothetical protein